MVARVLLRARSRVCFPNWSGFYPKQIRFVLGTAGFLLSCLSSLSAFGTIRASSSLVPSIKPLPQKKALVSHYTLLMDLKNRACSTPSLSVFNSLLNYNHDKSHLGGFIVFDK
jgi:hypothetical protein